MQGFSSDVTTIGHLVSGPRRFVVPPFQRNYLWGAAEYAAFWDDIWYTLGDQAAPYLLGFVVVSPQEDGTEQVIDGQQRLTTTLILFSALRAHYLAQGKKARARAIEKDYLLASGGLFKAPRPRLTLNALDQDFFHNNILLHQPAEHVYRAANDVAQPPSNQGLAACYRFMHQQIDTRLNSGMSLEDIGERILEGFRDRVAVIRIAVPDEINAYLLFEVLNQRGRHLGNDNLIKNHIYSRAGDELAEVQRNWETMEENLEALEPAQFVAYHWQANEGRISEKHGILFDIKGKVKTPEDARAYTDDLGQASRYYAALWSADHPLWPSEFSGQLAEIRKQVGFLRRMKAEQALIVLLASLQHDRRHFADILGLMTTFTFRFTTICGRPPSKLLPIYIEAARAIREGGGSMTAARLFDEHLSEAYPEDEEFRAQFAVKSIPRNANLARYILAELNNHLNGTMSVVTQLDPSITDLEHVLPIKFSAFWNEQADAFPGGPERYRHRLGNMTLINAELNKEVGNAGFAAKKEAYAADCLDITCDILKEEVWGAEQIDRRQQWMADLAVKIWRFPAA